MPRSRRLISPSQPQHQILPPVRPNNLQSNGQPALRKTARHGHSRQSPTIERSSVAQQPKLRGTQRLGIFFQIGNRRRRNRRRRRDQQIDVRKKVTSPPPLQIQLAQPLNILPSRNVLARPYPSQ